MCPASLYQAGIKQKLKQLIKLNKPLNQFFIYPTPFLEFKKSSWGAYAYTPAF